MATTAPQSHQALGDVAARQLANAQKTAPTMLSITHRWLVHLLPWVGVEAGIYRLNKVKDESRVLTACSQREDERPSASWDPASVTKGGPFDLGELERLANQMFTALPGALLPGLDPGQLESVALPPEAESQRPPREALASPDGHLTVAEPARETLAPGLEAAARNGAAGLMPAAANLTAAQDLSNLADLPQLDPNGPAALRPSIGGGLFELSGDPMPLSELGLAGLPRGMVEDPFAGSHYFLQESPRTAVTLAAKPWRRRWAPHSATIPSPHPGFDPHALRREFPALAERVHGRPLVWLDNGATTQKPEAVIGHEGTVRASLALYDTREDIDALIAALRQIATRTIELPRGTDHRFNTATP